MRLNIMSPILSTSRRHQFLIEYIKNNSGETDTWFVGGPMGGLATNAGADMGRGISAFIHATKIMINRSLYDPIKYAGMSFITLITFSIVLYLSPSSLQNLTITIVSIIMFISVIVIFVGTFLGKRDYKNHKKIKNKVGSPKAIDEMVSNLSAQHPETRLVAMQGINNVCQDTPGRVLKNTTHDPEDLATILVKQLSEKDEKFLEACSSSIKWLARDHGKMFVSHSKSVASSLESPHATVQINIAIALGNIAQFNQEYSSNYAQALAPAAKDLDSEVRRATATALGSIPCSESVTILEYLVDNETAPEVLEEAEKSLKNVRTQITT